MSLPPGIKPYPVYQVHDPAVIRNMPPDDAERYRLYLNWRANKIQRAEADRLRDGWESPIWRVAYALLGYNFFNPLIEDKPNPDWEKRQAYNKRMREVLGFDSPITGLAIFGGNRSAKTELAARTLQLLINNPSLLHHGKSPEAWMFHMSDARSIDEHQPRIWEYMPPEYRAQGSIKTQEEYITYKRQTGFGGGKFSLPGGGRTIFKNYLQERRTAIEGGEIDLAVVDEFIPVDWLDTLTYRIADRNGKIMWPFTPLDGYSPTVQYVMDGADVVKWSTGFLLPDDEGDPDPVRALGLNQEEYDEIESALGSDPKRQPEVIYARPEDCDAWIEGKPSQPEPSPGRRFKKVPRVAKCQDPGWAAIWIHSNDNPFGNPYEIIQRSMRGSFEESRIKIRYYGWAEKAIGARLAQFEREIHIIKPEDIPTEGDRYHLIDPATTRKWFMHWWLETEEAAYLYREWPGNYVVPGYGMPGAWATPGKVKMREDGSQKGLDGRPGPGSKTWGWGVNQYKREIARLERWPQYVARSKDAEIKSWKPYEHFPGGSEKADKVGAAPEQITLREVDSRAATSPRVEGDRAITLQVTLADWNLPASLTSGADIDEGIERVNELLSFDRSDDMSWFNKPKWYISSDCVNTIFAMTVWTGVDGQKGATKDPIDLLRYRALSGAGYHGGRAYTTEGGGYY